MENDAIALLSEVGNVSAWWSVGGALVSALISGFFVHYMTKDRDATTRRSILEREADVRRRTFLKSLHRFRSQMERLDENHHAEVWGKYTQLVSEFRGEAAMVDGDFEDQKSFENCVKELSEWRIAEIGRESPKHNIHVEANRLKTSVRNVICGSIDRMIEVARGRVRKYP